MTKQDYIQRFVFDQIDARGCYVRLDKTVEEIQATHHYPANLARTLNEFSVAAVLLRDSVKIKASVTLQLRTPGAIKLLMADCLSDKRVRAIAEYESLELAADQQIDLSALGKGSVLAVTITPEEGERYQSIVPIEKASLQACLEDYFSRSEQLPTWFSLSASDSVAVGIALHALPKQKNTDAMGGEESFSRLGHLLRTVSEQEALATDSAEMLTRLFHAEACRLFDPSPVEFGCPCSAQKSLDALHSLGESDVATLIAEQKEFGKDLLVIDCHFCFQRYEFSFLEVMGLFS